MQWHFAFLVTHFNLQRKLVSLPVHIPTPFPITLTPAHRDLDIGQREMGSKLFKAQRKCGLWWEDRRYERLHLGCKVSFRGFLCTSFFSCHPCGWLMEGCHLFRAIVCSQEWRRIRWVQENKGWIMLLRPAKCWKGSCGSPVSRPHHWGWRWQGDRRP